jgi:hypothetical protein
MPSSEAAVSSDLINRRRMELEEARGFRAGPQTRHIVHNAARAAHVIGGVLQGVSATSPL